MKPALKFLIKGEYKLLIARIRELDVITAVNGFGKGGLKVFCEFLCQRIGLENSKRTACATGIADDGTFIYQIVWSDEIIAAALLATKRYFNCVSHEVDCSLAPVA
jgi:hypothetical protein